MVWLIDVAVGIVGISLGLLVGRALGLKGIAWRLLLLGTGDLLTAVTLTRIVDQFHNPIVFYTLLGGGVTLLSLLNAWVIKKILIPVYELPDWQEGRGGARVAEAPEDIRPTAEVIWRLGDQLAGIRKTLAHFGAALQVDGKTDEGLAALLSELKAESDTYQRKSATLDKELQQERAQLKLERERIKNQGQTLSQAVRLADQQVEDCKQLETVASEAAREQRAFEAYRNDLATRLDEADGQTAKLLNWMQTAVDKTHAVYANTTQAELKSSDSIAAVQGAISAVEQIQVKLLDAVEKVHRMGGNSQQIGSILDAIQEIASQTNMLAINATIEAAHIDSQSHKLKDFILNHHMLIQAELINRLLIGGLHRARGNDFWIDVARGCKLDAICVTDADGVIVYCNEVEQIGWRFPNDPNAQAYPFRKLLSDPEAQYCQEIMERGVDQVMFKYVGIPRADQAGIVQVGFMAESLAKFDLEVGGFRIVANEVYNLARRSSEAAKEIGELISVMQKSADETEVAIQTTSLEINQDVVRFNQALKALEDVVENVKTASAVLTGLQREFDGGYRQAVQSVERKKISGAEEIPHNAALERLGKMRFQDHARELARLLSAK